MNPADMPLPADDPLQCIVRRLETHEANQDQVMRFLQDLASRFDQLQTSLGTPNPQPQVQPAAAPVAPVAESHSLKLSPPIRFSGDSKACRGFLSQCTIHFELLPQYFLSDRAKIAYIISLLSGEALAWAAPLWELNDPVVSSLPVFLKLFRNIFEEPARVSSAASALLRLRQESRSVGQYSLQFRIHSAELSWNNEALVATFLHGLSDRVKDELAGRTIPTDLDGVISLCNQIDIRFQERTLEKRRQHPLALSQPEIPSLRPVEHPLPTEEPMQLGRTRLSPEERARRRTLGLCLYCGGKSHFRDTCPLRPEKRSGSIHLEGGVLDPEISPSPSRLFLPVSLHFGASSHSVSAYLDSGAAGNFMDWEIASSMRLTLLPLTTPLVVSAIDGTVLPGGPIRFQTVPVKMSVGTLHQEWISFLVLPKASAPIVLGLPWLRLHSPHIDWTAGQILAWGPSCSTSCLPKVAPKEKLPVATIPESFARPTTCSGVRNVPCNSQADALSSQCSTLDEEPVCEPEPIIHSSLPLSVPKTHSQANLSTSSAVTTPCDAIRVITTPDYAIQSASASAMPGQPMPSEPPTFSCSGPPATCLRGSIHPLDRLPHSAKWGFLPCFQGSLHSADFPAIQLDSCALSPSNQPDFRVPLTSAQSDGPVLNPQFIFKGLLDPPRIPVDPLMPLLIPKRPLVLNKSSPPVPTSVLVNEDTQVLDSRLRRGVLQYLVLWRGFGPEEASWISASEIFAPHLSKRFLLGFPFSPGSRLGRGRGLKREGTVMNMHQACLPT